MKKNWYVVADRSGARVYEQVGVDAKLALVSSLDNPEGKLREREFVADREGRTLQTGRTGFNQYSVSQTQVDNVAEHFAKRIALELKTKSANYDHVVLVAEPYFMGKLRAQLDPQTEKKVRGSLTKDLGHINDRDMEHHLSEVLLTREPLP